MNALPSATAAWMAFVACAVTIAVAGRALCVHGDRIAARSGVSRSWIGLVMVAFATSLPEVVTGLVSVTLASAPDLAVADVFGSAVFNLGILGVLWAASAARQVPSTPGQRISAAFGAGLLGICAAAMAMPSMAIPGLPSVGWYTPLLLILYAAAMRAVHRNERDMPSLEAGARRGIGPELWRFGAAAAAVTVAGGALPFVAVALARAMGWSESLLGTLFVAGATSLPEVAVTVSALRMGAVDLAVGNLLGSNLVDMAILAVDDLAFRGGPLFSSVSPAHGISIASATVMTLVALAGPLADRGGKRTALRRLAGAALVIGYVLNGVMLRLHGG